MTLPRDDQETIRRMHADGASIRQIAREIGIARDTVAKYANLVDCSPTMPARRAYASPAMEPYADIVAAWLEGDEDRPRKQRHTAKRIFDRLVDECGYAGSVSTVERFVRNWRRSRPAGRATGFLELEWPPGVCQIDFGHAAAILAGERRELLLLAVSWPACNARHCVACPSHRSKSLCEGLTEIFEHVGRVPVKGILAGATEAGRPIAGEVRESELFAVFRAHCAMESDYCNPASGHEKGSAGERGRLPSPGPHGPPFLKPRASKSRAPGCSRAATCSSSGPTTERARRSPTCSRPTLPRCGPCPRSASTP